MANPFLVTEPPRDRRAVLVGQQRSRLDAHSSASPYAAFPPAETQWLAERRQVHHTPEHGSRHNTAEIALSILQRQCLGRWSGDREAMERAVAAWLARRDVFATAIDWHANAANTRTKLKRLYSALLAHAP